jgi:type II secretory pathway pseudopilin PulG
MYRGAQEPYARGALESGQSLVEVLLAVAIGAILITAGVSVIVPALQSNAQAAKIQTAASLGKELLDNVRVWSEGNWNNVLTLATGTTNAYYLNVSSSPFTAATGTESVVISTSTASSSVNLNSGLVGYWKFDEGTGTTAYDSSGNTNNGTWYGNNSGTSGHYSLGKIGPWSGAFAGSTNYVVTPSVTHNIGTQDFTFAAWIYLNDYSSGDVTGPTIMSNGPYVPWFGVDANQSGNNKSLSYYWGGWHRFNTSLPLTTWTNVVLVRHAGVISAYLNAVKESTTYNDSSNMANNYMLFGESSTGGTDHLHGLLDDARFYNRALSVAEISQLYSYALSSTVYSRSFYLSNVYRDSGGNIVTSGGTYDPSTKLVTVVYGWAGGPSYTMTTYVVRGKNNVLFQNDWSGGPGMSGPESTTNNQFASSSNIDYTFAPGSIYVAIPGY